MTDPSYRGQILVFTQPLIGNYGVPSSARDEHGLLKYFESPNIQCVGVVVADYAEKYSHWTAVESLSEWCAREGVPAISGVDTRAIVTHLREVGSSLARITIGEEYDADQDEAFIDPEQINLVKKVSTKAPFHVSSMNGDMHVAVIDCGVKENILRSLVGRGASVTVFPYDFPIHKVAHHFDGVFISNGPVTQPIAKKPSTISPASWSPPKSQSWVSASAINFLLLLQVPEQSSSSTETVLTTSLHWI
jgi:carbamoyl-phosphate synthase small subunit